MTHLANAQKSIEYINDLAEAKSAGDSADKYVWASICTLRETDTTHTFPYARTAVHLSLQSNDFTYRANAYFAISYAHFVFDNMDSAIYYAHKVIESYDHSEKKGRYYTYALNTIAGYYLNNGQAKEALEYGHKQLEAAVELKDTVSISNSYTMLAAIYEMQDNLPDAIKYAKKALALSEQKGDVSNRDVVLSNLASLLLKYREPEKALAYCNQAIYYCDEVVKSVRNAGTAFMLAGECHTQLGNLDSAQYYLKKADQYIENITTPHSKVKLWILYANASRATGNNDEAINYLKKAIDFAEELGAIKLISQASETYAELSALKGNYKIAYESLNKHKSINDSLTNLDVQSSIAEIREKYESDKKDERIVQQKRDNKYLTIGIVIAFVLMALILIQYIRQRAANKTIQEQSDKLTLLMKELHHRVKNNLQIISSLLSLQSFKIKDDVAAKAVREGQQRVEAMSLIHQRLYTKDDITEINIREFITDLVDSLKNAYGFHTDNFTVKLDIDNELMNVDEAIPLSLIINELVSNAFKYAYKDNEEPELTVKLKKDKDAIHLTVADNGKGIDIKTWENKGGSFGKELIQTFVAQLNGILTLAEGKGTTFQLTIPNAA